MFEEQKEKFESRHKSLTAIAAQLIFTTMAQSDTPSVRAFVEIPFIQLMAVEVLTTIDLRKTNLPLAGAHKYQHLDVSTHIYVL